MIQPPTTLREDRLRDKRHGRGYDRTHEHRSIQIRNVVERDRARVRGWALGRELDRRLQALSSRHSARPADVPALAGLRGRRSRAHPAAHGVHVQPRRRHLRRHGEVLSAVSTASTHYHAVGMCQVCKKNPIPPNRHYTCSVACGQERQRRQVHAQLDELLQCVRRGQRFPRRTAPIEPKIVAE